MTGQMQRLPRALLMLFAAAAHAAAQHAARAPVIELRRGLVITQSVRVVKRTYRLAASASLDSAVITIRGDGVTVDFGGATLEGAAPEADPDLAQGVAIRVEGGRDVRILNARVRGYKVGILARDTRVLTLAGNDLSYNWKPRLYSLVEHESLADWLSFHHNEKGEWLRFGAAIYLEGVSDGEIRGNRSEQGMNGLLMVRSDRLRVRDNTFSFNSGLGIGLYHSSGNTIVHNRVDYDVRGYSHGFYRRGQDSAGILIYEQSSDNVVAYNSVTHGGDGLFLWAGQSTMDSGEQGANDNRVVGNDFSFAPANGIEATFSRNSFVGNRLAGNDYGLWGGYSHDTEVLDNCFIENRVGIAIEHGQDNLVASNRFDGDSTAITLWANPIEPSDWGYPKHRDTNSRDYRIRDNIFSGNRVGMRVTSTSRVLVENNRVATVDSFAVLKDTSSYVAGPNRSYPSRAEEGTVFDACAIPSSLRGVAPDVRSRAALAGTLIPSSTTARLDRSGIVVDEWGPYDWRSPKLWPVDSVRTVPFRLRVLGPAGTWRLRSKRGVLRVSSSVGHTGDTIAVTPAPDSMGDWGLSLEYTGPKTVTPRGRELAAGARYGFGYVHFQPRMEWAVRFFAWDETSDPRAKPAGFGALLRSSPLLVRTEQRLDYEWYRPPLSELPQARWALEASAAVTLAPGEYTLRSISDDAVRIWVDGVRVVDEWTPHESLVAMAPIASGRHELRVEYYQVDGWTELRVDVVRGAQRAGGSPGPH
jgi:parallel beta-helix repeat protein